VATDTASKVGPQSYAGTGPKHQPNFPRRTTRPRAARPIVLVSVARHERESTHAGLITQRVEQSRLPAIYPYPLYAERGGLMTYTCDPAELALQRADDLHRVLHGAKPGEIPIYQATHFKFMVNLNAASTYVGEDRP
jgi:ABC-type uncharacterized transport system substrate-binding protein